MTGTPIIRRLAASAIGAALAAFFDAVVRACDREEAARREAREAISRAMYVEGDAEIKAYRPPGRKRA